VDVTYEKWLRGVQAVDIEKIGDKDLAFWRQQYDEAMRRGKAWREQPAPSRLGGLGKKTVDTLSPSRATWGSALRSGPSAPSEEKCFCSIHVSRAWILTPAITLIVGPAIQPTGGAWLVGRHELIPRVDAPNSPGRRVGRRAQVGRRREETYWRATSVR